MDQKSLVLVKPDGVRKHLIGEIIARFERRGLKICALKMLVMTKDQAKYHYAEHVENMLTNRSSRNWKLSLPAVRWLP